MARFAGTKVEFPELKEVRRNLQSRFSPRITAKFLGAAVKKASKPTETTLKTIVKTHHKKVTGNLYRSITTAVRRYPRTGNAVALVGFTKAGSGKTVPTGGTVQKGKDRAFHAGLIVFGTKMRRTKKGSIASSLKSRGPMRIEETIKRGKRAGQTRIRTRKFPFTFFKRAPKGEKVFLGKVYGTDPLRQALNSSQGQVRQVLRGEMVDIVERAARFLAMDFPARNRY